jgi:hypothetical protein
MQGACCSLSFSLLILGDWRQLRYKGDWMLRPIASNEIPWLVRLLVRINRAVNGALGLDGEPHPNVEEPETVLQVRRTGALEQGSGTVKWC